MQGNRPDPMPSKKRINQTAPPSPVSTKAAAPKYDGEMGILIEHSPFSMAMFDREMRYLHASRQWRIDHGIDERELRGLSHYDLLPEIPQRCRETHLRALAGETACCNGDHLESADGSVQWRNWDARPWRDAMGAVGGILVYGSDATTQQQRARELWETEANFRGFFEHLRLGAAQIGPQRCFVRVNESFCAMIGYSRQELLGGMGPLDLTHPEDREEARARIDQLVDKDGKSYEVERRYVRKDGQVIWVHLTISAILDADGRFLCSAAVVEDITERKGAEEELRRSQALLARAEQLSNTGAGELDLATGVWTFSDQWLTLHGCTKPHMTTGELVPIAHPDDQAAVERAFHDMFAGIAPFDLEFRFIRQDNGEVRFGRGVCELVCDADGRALKALGVVQDITGRKLAEKELRESEERFRQFMSNSPTVSWIKDEQGRYVYLSRTYEERFRTQFADWHGKTDAEMWPAETAETFRRHDQTVLDADHAIEVEEETINADGSRCYWLVSKFPFRDCTGRRFVCGIALDITERKAAEAALQESEERYRLLAENSADIIMLHSADGQLLYCSPSFGRITGWTHDELNASEWRERVHPDDLTAVERAHEANLRGEPTRVAYRHRCKNGSWIWLEIDCQIIFGPDGKPHHRLLTSRDITARRQAEEGMRLSEQKHRLLFESSRDAIMTMAPPDLRFTSGNPATIAMFRTVNEAAFVATAPWQLSPEFQPDGRRSEEKAREMVETAMREGSHFFEWMHQRLNGEVFPATVLLTRFELAGRPMLQGTVRDVTERKKAEAELRARELELKRVVDTAATGLVRCSRDLHYRWANPAFARLVGIPLNDVIGRPVAEVIGEQALETYRPYIERALHGEQQEFEIEIGYPSGPKFVHVVITPDENESGGIAGWFASVTDLSEQKALEREVLRIGESEQQRVAVELHDGICQELISIGFATKGMQRRLEKAGHRLAADMGVILKSVSQTATHTRLVAHAMNPVVVGNDGLMAALRELATKTTEVNRLCCDFTCPHPVSIVDPVVGNQLYRIAQEAITNAVRHSKGNRIDLELSDPGGEICLAVKDNGCGFPGHKREGFGVRSMNYRAELIHGTVVIRNRECGGTEVICRVPKR